VAYSDGPRGIGGWTLVFLISRGLAICLAGLEFTNTYSIMRPSGWRSAPWLFAWLLGTTLMYVLADGYIVWRFIRYRNWRTVQLGLTLLWLLTASPWLLSLIRILSGGVWPPFAYSNRLIVPSIILQFGITALWTVYFLRSKRVANTYFRYGEVDADNLTGVFE